MNTIMKVICPHCAEMIEVNYPGTEPRTAKCPECMKDFNFPPIVCQIVYDNKKRTKATTLYVREVLIHRALFEVLIVFFIAVVIFGITFWIFYEK